MKKFILFLTLLILILPATYALTGNIGNGRAILSGETALELVDGEATISRTILIRNVNNVPINIRLEPASDFVDSEFVSVDIIDKEFRLDSNEQKNAKYFVTVTKEGIYEGKINVFFTQIDDEGPGIVLPSVLIFVVEGEGSGDVINDPDKNNINNQEDPDIINPDKDDDGMGGTGAVTIGIGRGDKDDGDGGETDENKIGSINPFILIMMILVIIVVVLGVFVLLNRR